MSIGELIAAVIRTPACPTVPIDPIEPAEAILRTLLPAIGGLYTLTSQRDVRG